jgi:hypothetical protein
VLDGCLWLGVFGVLVSPWECQGMMALPREINQHPPSVTPILDHNPSYLNGMKGFEKGGSDGLDWALHGDCVFLEFVC